MKQLPSPPFPLTTHYFQHAKQIQIKLPQPPKPPQPPQLPPTKLYPSIPQLTPSTPPIPFISPPPHHHIYSIKHLPHLIHHLKNPNKYTNITLNLLSKTPLPTIPPPVPKPYPDKILITPYHPRTDPSPNTTIQHPPLPSHIRLPETHQTFMINHFTSP
ncbi:glutamate synthase-related protein, partial [Staphylococcus saprophyticus]|uniref:glutamate synthase-related protein n=1 Tax=Staphylococcus saprophyticus TaxID=29385 RepID=UPI003703EE0A